MNLALSAYFSPLHHLYSQVTNDRTSCHGRLFNIPYFLIVTLMQQSFVPPIQTAGKPDPISPLSTIDTSLEPVSRYRLKLVREQAFPYNKTEVLNSDRAAEIIFRLLTDAPQEIFGALYLDTRSRLQGYTFASVGTVNTTLVEARGIFVPALQTNAASMILFHNHPSGDPDPSDADCDLTQGSAMTGKLLGVPVLDHIIVGEPKEWFSFMREKPALFQASLPPMYQK